MLIFLEVSIRKTFKPNILILFMKKSFIIALVCIIVILVIGFVIYNFNAGANNSKSNIKLIGNNQTNSNVNIPANTDVNNAGSGAIGLAELANHNTDDDCWIVYNNEVYDITRYLNMHPGGARTITPYCGNTGFENSFLGKHGIGFESKLKSNSELVGKLA